MDLNSTHQRQYQRNHMVYSYTKINAEDQLVKELKVTGIVKVLDDFEVDDDNKAFFRSTSLGCTY